MADDPLGASTALSKLEQIERSVSEINLTNAIEHQSLVSTVGFITQQLTELKQDIHERLDQIREEDLKKIEAQTCVTNGRVTALERWRWIIGGALLIAVPLLIFLANTVLSNTGLLRKMEQIHRNELIQTPNTQEIQK